MIHEERLSYKKYVYNSDTQLQNKQINSQPIDPSVKKDIS